MIEFSVLHRSSPACQKTRHAKKKRNKIERSKFFISCQVFYKRNRREGEDFLPRVRKTPTIGCFFEGLIERFNGWHVSTCHRKAWTNRWKNVVCLCFSYEFALFSFNKINEKRKLTSIRSFVSFDGTMFVVWEPFWRFLNMAKRSLAIAHSVKSCSKSIVRLTLNEQK